MNKSQLAYKLYENEIIDLKQRHICDLEQKNKELCSRINELEKNMNHLSEISNKSTLLTKEEVCEIRLQLNLKQNEISEMMNKQLALEEENGYLSNKIVLYMNVISDLEKKFNDKIKEITLELISKDNQISLLIENNKKDLEAKEAFHREVVNKLKGEYLSKFIRIKEEKKIINDKSINEIKRLNLFIDTLTKEKLELNKALSSSKREYTSLSEDKNSIIDNLNNKLNQCKI